jgi:hypothetical protein
LTDLGHECAERAAVIGRRVRMFVQLDQREQLEPRRVLRACFLDGAPD